MVNLTILAGGYDLFIASYLFNSDASTLSLLNKYPTGTNPSWLAPHPSNKSILYATNQDTDGAVQSFTVTPSGEISGAISTVTSGGARPAHAAALTTGQVAAVNYAGGNARIVPTVSGQPLLFDDTSAGVISFPGEAPHPHMALEYGNEVLIPDLGGDTVWRLVEDGSPGNWKIAGSIDQPPGSGPRHIAVVGLCGVISFHPGLHPLDDILYTLHELSSTLGVQAIPELGTTNTSAMLDIQSIIPSDAPVGSAYGAAEILIPPPNSRFKTRYIYVSNRNIGEVTEERGDSIAIFEYTDGRLNLVNQFFTGLDQVRGMEFGGEDDEYLVASGVVGDGGVAVFKRIEEGRYFEEVARDKAIPNRTSFVWLE